MRSLSILSRIYTRQLCRPIFEKLQANARGLRILKPTCRDKPRIGTVPLDIHFFSKSSGTAQSRAVVSTSKVKITCILGCRPLIDFDIHEQLPTMKYICSRGFATTWLGGLENDQGKFVWSDGTSMTYTNGNNGVPSLKGCMFWWDHYGRWYEAGCDRNDAYICKIVEGKKKYPSGQPFTISF